MRFVVLLSIVLFVLTSDTATYASDQDGAVYLFPSVIEAILANDLESVPDDQIFRAYIVSVYKGIYDVCSPGADGIGLDAAQYGFPQTRQLLKTGSAGTGNLWGLLADMSSSGSILDATLEATENTPQFYEVGVEDGLALSMTHKCNSIAVRSMKIRMRDLFAARKEARPERNDLARWQKLMHPQWLPILGDRLPPGAGDVETLAEEASLAEVIADHANPESMEFRVSSTGLRSGVTVAEGDIIKIRATGYIKVGLFAGSAGPGGIDGFTPYNRVPGFKHGALLVRVDSSPWMLVPQDLIFKAPGPGELIFTVNDKEPQNNSGHFNVSLMHYAM